MAKAFDRMRLAPVADWLVVAAAASLPWSTSATAILVVLWLIALLPTFMPSDFQMRRDLATAAALLPLLLVLLGALGMLWADVSWVERFKGMDSFVKLLAIPLLLMQFRRSDRGTCVFIAYLVSSTLLLLASTVIATVPDWSAALMHFDGVIVKNAPTQSGEFVTCIAGMLFLGKDAIERRCWWWLAALLAVALGMLANMFFVATGRTALVVLGVLITLFALRELSLRGAVVLFAGAVAIFIAGWTSSPYLRQRIETVWTDLWKNAQDRQHNSSSERVDFAMKSIAIIRAAPVIGHGTGTIHAMFSRMVAPDDLDPVGAATTNPHNQIFAVAIQVGLLGAAVLCGMWGAHLLLFRSQGLAQWVGLMIVTQNIIGSLFNSHLFDFMQGWVYVVGVGVAGGISLRRRPSQ